MSLFRVCKNLYAGSYARLCILFFIMTLAMQSLTLAIGMLRYNRQIEKQIANLQSLHGVYLSHFEQDDASYENQTVLMEIAEIEQLVGVRKVTTTPSLSVTYQNKDYTIIVFDDVLSQYFSPWDISGEGLADKNDVLISGYRKTLLKQNAKISFLPSQSNEDAISYSFNIAGFLRRSSYVPKFSRSNNQLALSGMLYPAYGHTGNYMIISEQSDFYKSNRDSFYVYRNLLILFDEDISSEAEQELLVNLSARGLVMEFDEIKQNTLDECQASSFTVKYLILFSFMTLVLIVGISISVVQEKHRELAVYSICGCGRISKIILSSMGIALTTIVSFLFQSVMIQHYFDLRLYRYFEHVVVDNCSIGIIAGYALLVCFVCAVSSYCMNGRRELVYYLQENRK